MQTYFPDGAGGSPESYCFRISILDAIDFLFGYFMIWQTYHLLFPNFCLPFPFWMLSYHSTYWKPYLVFTFLCACIKCQQLGHEALWLCSFLGYLVFWTNFFLCFPIFHSLYPISRCSFIDFGLKGSSWSHPVSVPPSSCSQSQLVCLLPALPWLLSGWGWIPMSYFLTFLLWKAFRISSFVSPTLLFS